LAIVDGPVGAPYFCDLLHGHFGDARFAVGFRISFITVEINHLPPKYFIEGD
jgi:hypothetical protein